MVRRVYVVSIMIRSVEEAAECRAESSVWIEDVSAWYGISSEI